MIYTVETTELEESILKHELLDIQDWLEKALIGRINKVKLSMLSEAHKSLLKDPDTISIPATEQGVLEAYMALSSYKDRATRQAEMDTELIGDQNGTI